METERGQAEMLVPMINRILEKSGYSFPKIDRIGVTTGPGSFTGLRVGLSTARALALTLNKPLIGFSTLAVLAEDRLEESLILIDTKRGDFYGQIFKAGMPLEKARIWTPEEVEESGMQIIKDRVPDIRRVAHMIEAFETGLTSYDPLQAPHPIYLRNAEISQTKRIAPKII